jgi:HAD superfamily hydrolase (TIGR01490 family)
VTNPEKTAQKLAIFDLDGTLYRWQLFHELVFCLKDKGVFTEEASLLLDEAYAAWTNRHTSFGMYERQVVDTLIDSLPNLSPAAYDAAAQGVAERTGRKTYRYTLALIRDLKAKGYFLLAVSGSQQEIAEKFAKKFDFDDCIGSLYERVGDRFTGAITRFVPGHKHTYITQYADAHGFDLTGSIAVGDSDGDISMLELVDYPIAFNPNDGLLKVAQEKGWKIVVERKNVAMTLTPGANARYTLSHIDTY